MLVSKNYYYRISCALCRSFSAKRFTEEKVEIPEAKPIARPWNEVAGIRKSTLSYFKPRSQIFGVDMIKILQTPIDFSPTNVKSWYQNSIEEQEEWNQRFIEDRLEALGPDLAAAHFVVHRGGAIKFYNEKEWIRLKPDRTASLPSKFVTGLFLEAIDCQGMKLRKAGFENIIDLPKLKWLSLAENQWVDDWAMDLFSGSYRETLQYLNISKCPKITHRSLSCFYRFKKLDTLIVEGIANDPEFKLSCMMLEDIRPMLTIKGIDHDKINEDVGKTQAEKGA